MDQGDGKARAGLVSWLAGGLPLVLQAGNIPPGLVSGPRCQRLAMATGDGILGEAATALGVGDGPALGRLSREAPDLNAVLSTQDAQRCIVDWLASAGAAPVLHALAGSAARIRAAAVGGGLRVDPEMVVRGLLVLALLPFFPGTLELRGRVGAILRCSPSRWDRAVVAYARVAVQGDGDRVARVDGVINSDPVWGIWSTRFLGQAQYVEPYGARFLAVPDARGQAAWNVLWNRLME